MVASGIPERNGNRHITCIAELSLDLIKTMGDFRVPQLRGERLLIRIGFCTGILDFDCCFLNEQRNWEVL